MPIEINGQQYFKYDELPRGASLVPRQPKALTGLEVSECLARQIAEVYRDNWDAAPIQVEEFEQEVLKYLRSDGRLNKEHLTYPKVSWSGRVYSYEGGGPSWEIEIWTDSVKHFTMSPGYAKWGNFDTTKPTNVAFGMAPSNVPDSFRRRFNLPIFAKATFPDGTTRAVVLPSNFEFGVSGLPTAAAKREKEMAAMASTPPVQPRFDPSRVTPEEIAAIDLRLPMRGPIDLPAADLVADSTVDYNQIPAGSTGSIAKAPPKGATLGRSKGRK